MLDKSRADWKDYKKADDTIEEELEMHKRSGDQVRRPGAGRAVGWGHMQGQGGGGAGGGAGCPAGCCPHALPALALLLPPPAAPPLPLCTPCPLHTPPLPSPPSHLPPPIFLHPHPPPPLPQYLDKQAFLKEAELREYEKERDRRLASDVRNRGRL